MSLNMFKHMESLFRIFCEAELRFKMKMSFYIIADNLFVQKLVFSHPKETFKALWSVLACSCVYNNSPRGFRPMIPAAWNVDSTERVAVCPSATDVRPFTHTIGKHRQMDACSDLNPFTFTCCDLLTEVYIRILTDRPIYSYK